MLKRDLADAGIIWIKNEQNNFFFNTHFTGIVELVVRTSIMKTLEDFVNFSDVLFS